MNSRSRSKWALILIISAIAIPAAAEDSAGYSDPPPEVCKFERPKINDKPDLIPKVKRVSDVNLNGTPIPTYSLAIDDPDADSGYTTYTPKVESISVKPKADDAKQFKAYGTPMGTVIVPADWIPREGAIGTNASFHIVFAPDTTGQIYLLVESDGFCAGCSQLDSSMYFGHSVAREEDDPLFTCLKPSFVRTVEINPNQVAYQINADNKNPIDGVAYYSWDDNIQFWNAQISMPKDQHALASKILNQFVIHKKTKARQKEQKH